MPGRKLNATQNLTLLSVTLTAAVTAAVTEPVTTLGAMESLTLLANFDYGSGGTSVTAHVQTSLDGGVTWMDVAAFGFTTADAKKVSSLKASTAVAAAYTPTDATLTSDTIKDGLLGDRLRIKYTSVGIYAGATTLTIHAVTKG